MINLFEMMQNAQGGQAVDNLARQFGLTPNQSEAPSTRCCRPSP